MADKIYYDCDDEKIIQAIHYNDEDVNIISNYEWHIFVEYNYSLDGRNLEYDKLPLPDSQEKITLLIRALHNSPEVNDVFLRKKNVGTFSIEELQEGFRIMNNAHVTTSATNRE